MGYIYNIYKYIFMTTSGDAFCINKLMNNRNMQKIGKIWWKIYSLLKKSHGGAIEPLLRRLAPPRIIIHD